MLTYRILVLAVAGTVAAALLLLLLRRVAADAEKVRLAYKTELLRVLNGPRMAEVRATLTELERQAGLPAHPEATEITESELAARLGQRGAL